MILAKQIAVYLNLVHCELKQYISSAFKQKNINFTPEQFLLIDLLWNEGTLSQQHIADTLHKDKNSITKLVDALEKKHLVTRKTDQNDRRSNLVALTDKANAIKNDMKQFGIHTLESIIQDIPEDDLKSFLDVLERLSSNMKQIESQR